MRIKPTTSRLLIGCFSFATLLSFAPVALSSDTPSSPLRMPADSPALTSAAEALHSLKQAEALESSRVGFAAQLSPRLQELMVVLSEPNAVALMKNLYAEGTLAGKMYALIGLQLADQAALSSDLIAEASEQAGAGATIEMFEGCILHEVNLDQVLPRIADGSWSASFQDEWKRYQQKE